MKTLFVASSGGHLAQLYTLSKRMNSASDRVWVTFDTPQSQSLLAGEEVYFVPFVGTRDLLGTARAAVWARDFLRNNHFDMVVSTGASIAFAVLPLAARAGADCHYIESATRTNGPSLTGRLLMPFNSVRLHTQYKCWADRRWTYQVSIFDEFRSFPVAQSFSPRRIVVSLGMHQEFGFRRLLERLVQTIPDGTDVLWQVGYTDTSGLNIDGHVSLSADELSRAMANSDVVITHAGVGSAISALEVGKRPILVPRRKQYREHVDDHQALIAEELDRRELAFHVETEELRWNDLLQASSWRVVRESDHERNVEALQKI